MTRLMRRVLLLGGTSEIGLATMEQMAQEGPMDALLLGRDLHRLEQAAAQLDLHQWATVATMDGLDAADPSEHGRLLDAAFAQLGGVDLALIATGVLGRERSGLPQDLPAALAVLQVDFTGTASLLLGTAQRMREQGNGTVVVLSSAAAVRPRRSNAVYGAAKAGLDSLAQALSDELRPTGVKVIVVRPGHVRTRMTYGLPEPPLACEASDVAKATLAGLQRDSQTIWAPPSMRWAMLALQMLPRALFRRLSL